MKFIDLAAYLETIEGTASSNDVIDLTAEMFHAVSAEEIRWACYLMLGTLGAPYTANEFGLSDKLVIRSIAHALKVEQKDIEKRYREVGDLGLVFSKSARSTSAHLTVQEVYTQLSVIADLGGKGSIDAKVSALSLLLAKLSPSEGKFVIRIVLDRLRTGLADAKVLDALSVYSVGDKSLRTSVERAYNVLPDIGVIAQTVLEKGVAELDVIQANPGIPIRPAQAERLPTPEKIVQKLEEFAVEPKMDGFRVQIHVWTVKGQKHVALFSRNLNETTHMFPDITEAAKLLPIESGIFDSEALAFNPNTSEYLSFQDTVKRRRKHGVTEMSAKVPLRVFLFDVLFLNGKVLLGTAAKERFHLLSSLNYSTQDVIEVTRHDTVRDETRLRKLFDLYISEGLEGVMCKKLDAVYQAGSRNFNWVKYKRATDQALNDTVDGVVLGYYVGQGQRNKFGIGAFLVGIYDEASGMFQSLAKIGTGLTDAQWIDIKKQMDSYKTSEKPNTYDVHKNLAPDTWVLPKLVVEVAADEITKSPIHTAAKGEKSLEGSGLALRFPRLVSIRTDKSVYDTTSPHELLSLYDR